MKIRKATKKDFNEIAELMNKEYSKPPYDESWEKKNAIKTLNYFSKIGNIVVICEKNILGFVVFREEYYNTGSAMMIEDIIVDSDYQGKGLGKKLVEYVEQLARKKKVGKVWLLTLKNAPAFNFYKKLGYKLSDKTVVFGKELK